MILITVAVFIFAEVGFISANPSPLASHVLVSNTDTYPFVAALRRNEKFVCAGAIIAPNAVLTTASCAKQLVAKNCDSLTATAGMKEADTDCFAKYPNLQVKHIKNIAIHPGFSQCTENNNDIAVVILDGNFAINKHVRPIKLVEGARTCLNGKTVDIVGWGVTKCGGKVNDLAVTFGSLQSEADCKKSLSPLQKPETIGCAKMAVEPDLWHGSGSPVVIVNNNKCETDTHILVGIAVNPVKQTKFKNPFVFTEIYNVSKFIKGLF